MTKEHFRIQLNRLALVWPKSFPDEKQKLLWVATNCLSDYEFTYLCDRFISSMKSAPVPDDFITEVRKIESAKFKRDTMEAAKRVFNWDAQKGLKDFLDRHYPGATCLQDAVDIQRMRLRNGEVTVDQLLNEDCFPDFAKRI